MANVINDIYYKILARGLRVLRTKSVMPRLVNMSYSNEAAQKGDTINIPDTASIGTRDVVPSNTAPAPVDSARRTIPLTLDTWRQSDPFYLTDKEMAEIDRNDSFMPQRVTECVEALASYVNAQIMSEYVGIYSYTGSVSDLPFSSGAGGIRSATNARKVLAQNSAPNENRRGVLDFDEEAEAIALDAFRSADQIFSNAVVMSGEIGMKLGIGWVGAHGVPSHTTGATGTPLVDNGAGYSVPTDTSLKSQTIHIDGLSTLPVAGDLLSFAGHTQSYTVIAVSNPSLPDADITIAPALKADIADGEALTFVASHKVNLVFHRDAFAYATRPLAGANQVLGTGHIVREIFDPETGLTLRLEVSRQHKQTVWEFDILFGKKLVRPELAVRLIGPP